MRHSVLRPVWYFFITSLLVVLGVCSGASRVAAATVTLDGQTVTPVFQRNGHLLIPFRAPMERVGATVNWTNPTATANMSGQQLVTVNMGDTNALIKGTTHPLSVAPELIGGSAYVPVEALTDICGAQVTYSADRTSANVTGCTLANINTIGAVRPFNFWPWLIGLIVVLGALWAWSRSRAKAVYRTPYADTVRTTPTTPNVVRGTIDDYTTRLKSALNHLDNSHRASFVQQLSQAVKENRSTTPETFVTSTKPAFDAAASGAPTAVSSLVDQFSDRPQLLQIAVKKFAALFPGELGTLIDGTTTRT